MTRVRERLEALAYRAAWRWLRHVPPEGRRHLALVVGSAVSALARHGRSPAAEGPAVMREIYSVLHPQASQSRLDALVRQGVQEYAAYFVEAFALPGSSSADLVRAVRPAGDDQVRRWLGQGRGVVCFLAHMGNWDLAGAWAAVALAPVTTVAERLEPAEVFDEFLAFREGLGMTVLPLDGGPRVLVRLQQALRRGGFVPLLADRDLTGGGIEVTLAGRRLRAATGPAALALSTGAALVPVSMRHEPAAGAPGGRRLVITFHDEVVPPPHGSDGAARREALRAMTQACLTTLEGPLREHTTEWHLLQPVLVGEEPA